MPLITYYIESGEQWFWAYHWCILMIAWLTESRGFLGWPASWVYCNPRKRSKTRILSMVSIECVSLLRHYKITPPLKQVGDHPYLNNFFHVWWCFLQVLPRHLALVRRAHLYELVWKPHSDFWSSECGVHLPLTTGALQVQKQNPEGMLPGGWVRKPEEATNREWGEMPVQNWEGSRNHPKGASTLGTYIFFKLPSPFLEVSLSGSSTKHIFSKVSNQCVHLQAFIE